MLRKEVDALNARMAEWAKLRAELHLKSALLRTIEEAFPDKSPSSSHLERAEAVESALGEKDLPAVDEATCATRILGILASGPKRTAEILSELAEAQVGQNTARHTLYQNPKGWWTKSENDAAWTLSPEGWVASTRRVRRVRDPSVFLSRTVFRSEDHTAEERK